MTDRIEEGLKPCPFCGSKWIVAKYVNNPFDKNHIYGGYATYCDDCCCITNNFKTIEEAVEAWNRRTTYEENNG